MKPAHLMATKSRLRHTKNEMSDYEYDIFLSYRRSDAKWIKWTRDNFAGALRTLLRPALHDPRIYVDENIEVGASWPTHLARNLSHSKLLVAVLSRDYFKSDWCRLEIALMHRREKLVGLRTLDNPLGLIIPVIIDDGECFPMEIKAMKCTPFHEFANPYIREDSPKQEDLAECLRTNICPSIEKALKNVPKFDAKWEKIAYKQFIHMFHIQIQEQLTVPRLTLPRKL